MNNITIKKIQTRRELEQFVDFRSDLYKDSPVDVPYLFSDEVAALTKGKNPSLEFCEAEYYMAFSEDGKPLGRVAAIINHRANEEWNTKDVRFGWFDFVDDPLVSRMLMDKVKEFGRSRGMNNIIGPMGFTDLDREGMLVEGFDHIASMLANHNFEYYRTHMEQMTEFEKDNDWIQLSVPLDRGIPDKIQKMSSIIESRYNLHARKPTRRELFKEGMAHRIFDILNISYAHLYKYSSLDSQQIDSLLETFKPVIDPELISIVTDGNCNDEVIGFAITFPSLSKALQRTDRGRMLPFGWYHLLKAVKFHDFDLVDLMLVAVLPEYRNKGVQALIMHDLHKTAIKYGIKEAMTLAMMETNTAVLGLWQHYENEVIKCLRSYRADL